MATLDVNPQRYQEQLAEKVERLTDMFAPYNMPELEVFESPEQHYRMRAEFRVWHEGEDLYYIMFNQETREKYRVDQFPAASRLINDLMPLLVEAMKDNDSLRRKLFQVDFLSTLSGEILVSLLYHRQLDEEWIENAKALKQRLNDEGFNLNIIGRARKMKIVLDRDYVIESFNQDVPFNQFVREQVAGDLLGGETLEQRRRRLIGAATLQGEIARIENERKSDAGPIPESCRSCGV